MKQCKIFSTDVTIYWIGWFKIEKKKKQVKDFSESIENVWISIYNVRSFSNIEKVSYEALTRGIVVLHLQFLTDFKIG